MRYYNSRYNFCFPVEGGVVLYNAATGCTSVLSGADHMQLSEMFCSDKLLFEVDSFETDTLSVFLQSGFLIEEYRDELLEIRTKFWTARDETPVVLTLTTTMDCNLGCYYCYESRSKHQLAFTDLPELINRLKIIFENNSKQSLHVDWYGGEPLMNISFMEEASYAIQNYCQKNNIRYHSSIISNGTLWPEDLKNFIGNHKIREVQISFDGLKENHNKKRRYRKEFLQQEDNSFDIIVSLVDRLLEFVQVDIRLNIDWKVQDEVMEFIEFITRRGWFTKKYPAVFQPARIAPYTDKSAFLEHTQLSLNEFDQIRYMVAQKLNKLAKVEESEVPDGFPFPKNYVCAALARDSFVVGADKFIYRCGLQVGEVHRAVGSLEESHGKRFADKTWWDDFDPTILASCSKCSFLPVCHGGCPKKHLDRDQKALEEQSLYWRNNLASKVLAYTGFNNERKIVLLESDQFRRGYN